MLVAQISCVGESGSHAPASDDAFEDSETLSAVHTGIAVAPHVFAELADGRVLAMSASEDRLVVLGDSIGREIPIRRGRGPGEVQAVGRLFGTEDGFGVWDDALQRVSLFDSVGRVLHSATLPAWRGGGGLQVVRRLDDGRYVGIRSTQFGKVAVGNVVFDSVDVIVGSAESAPRRLLRLPAGRKILLDGSPVARTLAVPRTSPLTVLVCREGLSVISQDSVREFTYDGAAVRAFRRFWPAFPLDAKQMTASLLQQEELSPLAVAAAKRFLESALAERDSIVPEPLVASDGNLWLSVPGGKRSYAQFTPAGDRLRTVQLPTGAMTLYATPQRLYAMMPDIDDVEPSLVTLRLATPRRVNSQNRRGCEPIRF